MNPTPRRWLTSPTFLVVFLGFCAHRAWTLTTEYIGPGSMGDFVSMAMAPTDPDLLLAGADVGGIYLSADAGASWKNVTLNLPVQGVFSIAFSELGSGATHTLRAIIGTESGIYYSNSFGVPITGCSTTAGCNAITSWGRGHGLEALTLTTAKNSVMKLLNGGDTFVAPVSVVSVDPNNQGLIWAGIGRYGTYDLARHADNADGYQVQRFDRWKVYRSTDRGLNWVPMLRLTPESLEFPYLASSGPGSLTDTAPDTAISSIPNDDAQVFGIQVLPGIPRYTLVSTDRGLYRGHEDESGWTWLEIGTSTARETSSGGLAWTSATAGCSDWTTSTTDTSWCLPTVSSAWVRYLVSDTGEVSDYLETTRWATDADHEEQHPDLRSLAYTWVTDDEEEESEPHLRLYVAAWDVGWGETKDTGGTPICDSGIGPDTLLELYRGGIYASDDYGDTWTWLFTDDGAPDGTPIFDVASRAAIQYRCDEFEDLRASDNTFLNFGSVAAIPSYTAGSGGGSDEIVLVAGGYGDAPGIYTYTVQPTPEWTWHSADPGGWSNYEGNTPYNLDEEEKTPMRGSAGGKVLVEWTGSSTSHPSIYQYSGPRGIIKATWSGSAYDFDHLGDDDVGTATAFIGANGDQWASTGLDDACIFAAVDGGNYTFVGGSDGGVLRFDSAGTYEGVAALSWIDSGCTGTTEECLNEYEEDETRAIEVDYTTDPVTVYAANYKGSTTGSVLRSEDEGDTWEIIGGTGAGSTWNGLGDPLGDPVKVTELQVVPPSYDLVLLAGGKYGLWGYDGSSWSELCSSDTFDGHTGLVDSEISDITIDEDLAPGYAYFTVSSNDHDSLVAFDLTYETCTSLSSSSSTAPFFGATAVGIIRGRAATGPSCSVESSPAVLIVGASPDGGGAYDALFAGVLDASPGTILYWQSTAAADLATYGSTPPGGLDGILWTNAAKQLEFTDIAVDPTNQCNVWAAIGQGPYFDYVNARGLYQRNMATSTYTFNEIGRGGLGLPNGNVKSLRFNDDGELYVGSCSSLYRITF